MNINEIKAQKAGENSGIFTIIFGRYGVGKSTMASTFPNALCLDLEGTAGNINGLKRVRIERGSLVKGEDSRDKPLREIHDYVKQFLESEFKTLILDGGIDFVRIMQDYTLKKLGREKMSDHKYGDTYVESRDTAENFIKMLLGKGKNLVLICHTDEVVEVDPSTDEEYVIYRPELGDKKLVNKLPALSNIVGMVEVDGKGNRKFNCIPNSRNVLKNQFDIKEKIEPTYDALIKEIKKYYKQ